MAADPVTIYSAGHGSREIGELLDLLRSSGIACLVDVRSFPGSRKFPHFGREPLAESLAEAEIGYLWEGKDLGGFRRPRDDSPHTALRTKGFRSYADHMESSEFRQGAERLLRLARASPTAFLCAERLPWRCHRYLLADYLVFRGARVVHLLAAGKSYEHRLSPLARPEGDHLVYDRPE